MEISEVSAPSIAPTPVSSAAQVVSAEPTRVSDKAAAVDPGPPTRVSISQQARAQLRAAGVPPADMATINLLDAGAVTHAVQRARALEFRRANTQAVDTDTK
jgi:hypothetical protein